MQLKIFENGKFNIRGGLVNNEPYFVLADVCKILEIVNSTDVKNRLKKDGVVTVEVIDSLGRKQKATAINEANIYKVIFQSRKPEAEAFQEWVTSEVLPSIRKHGGYLTDSKIEDILTNPDTIIQLATQLKEERAKAKKALNELETNKPLVEFAKAVGESCDTLSIGDFAKVLNSKNFNIGEKRLFELLRSWGYLTQDNKPKQRFIDQGLFELKEKIYKKQGDLTPRLYLQTRITPKGQRYFIKVLWGDDDPCLIKAA